MTIVHKRALILSIAALALSSASWSAAAQTYPDKPIKIIVTVAAGGPMDTIARFVGQQMQMRLGPARGGREPARRGLDARRQGRLPGRTRRQHPDVGHAVHHRDRAGALQGPRLRPESASRMVGARRGIPARRGDSAEPAGQHDGGVHRLCQSPSRRVELRRLARHAAAAARLDVQQGRRSRHDLCALQGRRAIARPI